VTSAAAAAVEVGAGLTAAAPAWPTLVAALTDTARLGPALEKRLPTIAGVHALISEVVPGVGQVALHPLSLGDSALVSSRGRYNAASAVKIIAAVSALVRLRAVGMTSAAVVSGTLDGERFVGPARDLVSRAMVYSDNEAYDWLQALAGHDLSNEGVLARPYRWPSLAMRSRFHPRRKSAFFLDTPAFSASEGGRVIALPAMRGHRKTAACDTNCVSLAALQDFSRRVLLYFEIDPAHRFDLDDGDRALLREYMHHAADRFSVGAAAAFGGPVQAYTRFGNVDEWFTGNGMVTRQRADPFEPGRGTAVHAPRYLITFATPNSGASGWGDRARTAKLVEALLRAAAAVPRDGPPLQTDGGQPIALSVRRVGDGVEVSFRAPDPTAAATGAPGAQVWFGRSRAAVRAEGGRFVALGPLSRSPHTGPQPAAVVTVRTLRGGAAVGHRSVWIGLSP